MQKNTICINCGSIGHRVYDCEEVNSFTIEMGWGRYNNHQIISLYCQENKCQVCIRRINNSETYCFDHYYQCQGNGINYCSKRITYIDKYCWDCATTCQVCSLYKIISEEEEKNARCAVCNVRYLDEQNHLKSLVKEQTNLSNIQEVTKFTTPWNNNCATIIIYQDNYSVFLGLIDRVSNTSGKVQDGEIFVYPKEHDCSYWGEHSRKQHDSLNEARKEAKWLRTELSKGYGKYHEHPILLIHPYCDCSRFFGTFVSEPYVVKRDFADRKVGDILWVRKKIIVDYYHVGICLGKDKIAHYSGEVSAFIPYLQNLQRKFKIIITNTEKFLEKQTGESFCYHPIIPFKNYQKIIEQAVKAWWANYGEGKYDLANHQCEHVANSLVLGINYSKQIEDRKDEMIVRNIGRSLITSPIGSLSRLIRGEYSINNSKGSVICLESELKSYETNGRFNSLTNELREERNKYEQEYQAQIISPLKTGDCIVM